MQRSSGGGGSNSAAAAPGESQENFGAASPAFSSEPSSCSPGWATLPRPQRRSCPGAGWTCWAAARGSRQRWTGSGAFTAWPVPGRGRPEPGPRRADWPAGWKRVCKVLGGRPWRAAGPRRQLQRLGSAPASLRILIAKRKKKNLIFSPFSYK